MTASCVVLLWGTWISQGWNHKTWQCMHNEKDTLLSGYAKTIWAGRLRLWMISINMAAFSKPSFFFVFLHFCLSYHRGRLFTNKLMIFFIASLYVKLSHINPTLCRNKIPPKHHKHTELNTWRHWLKSSSILTYTIIFTINQTINTALLTNTLSLHKIRHNDAIKKCRLCCHWRPDLQQIVQQNWPKVTANIVILEVLFFSWHCIV